MITLPDSSSPTTSCRSRSTTRTPAASRSRSSRARSPSPTAARSRTSSSCRAVPATRRRGRPATRADPAGSTAPLQDFRVLMLDQRGTGRSTPVHGDEPLDYLSHFRADTIVRDAELLREALGSPPWSRARPELRRPLHPHLPLARARRPARGVDHRRRAGHRRLRRRRLPRHLGARRSSATGATTTRYPEDRERVRRSDWLGTQDVAAYATAHRAACALGNLLGMSDGYERLHYILELPPDSPAFLHDTDDPLEVARNPIYALLHEACWADGEATNWSAERMQPDVFEEQPELFTAEHILPWVFEEYASLEPRDRARARRPRVAAALRPRRARRTTRSRPRRRSTRRTSTSSARSPRRRRESSRACAPG